MRREVGDEPATTEAPILPLLTFGLMVRSFRYANRCLPRTLSATRARIALIVFGAVRIASGFGMAVMEAKLELLPAIVRKRAWGRFRCGALI